MTTRRDVLTALLGAPLAAAACERPRAVPGRLLGASHEVGHRLRGADAAGGRLGASGHATPEQVPGPVRRVPVVIVGAGPAGLAAAWRLERSGFRDFVVVDLEAQAGGTSASGTDGVVPYPWGAHYVPVPRADQRELVTLLGELGALEPSAPAHAALPADAAPAHAALPADAAPPPPRGREGVLIRQPEERVFLDGRWHAGLWPGDAATPADQDALRRFQAEVDRWVAFRDGRGRRAFTLPLRQCSDAAEVVALDRSSAADWLRERDLTAPLFRWWAEYATKDDYGSRLEHTSAWAFLFYFAARRTTPGGDAAEGRLAGPRSGDAAEGRLAGPRSGDAAEGRLAGPRSGDAAKGRLADPGSGESQPFLTWPEGNGRVVSHLAGVAGTRLELGRLVTDVVPDEGGVELAVWERATGALARWRAERVILAVPRLVCERVLRPWREARRSSPFRYGPWLVANLHLRERPRERGVPLSWDNVLHGSASLGYVVATHQALRDRGPTVLTWYLPVTDRDPRAAREWMLELDHAAAAGAVLADLGTAHPDLPALVERLDVWRWGHAMVRPEPGFVWSPERRAAAEPLGRVHFGHSDLSGIALLEEAVDRGVAAADAVLERLRG